MVWAMGIKVRKPMKNREQISKVKQKQKIKITVKKKTLQIQYYAKKHAEVHKPEKLLKSISVTDTKTVA